MPNFTFYLCSDSGRERAALDHEKLLCFCWQNKQLDIQTQLSSLRQAYILLGSSMEAKALFWVDFSRAPIPAPLLLSPSRRSRPRPTKSLIKNANPIWNGVRSRSPKNPLSCCFIPHPLYQGRNLFTGSLRVVFQKLMEVSHTSFFWLISTNSCFMFHR